MDKRPPVKYLYKGGRKMKIKTKLSFNFELETQRKSKGKKSKKKSPLKKSLIWVALEILSILLEKLVTWIIKLITNRPFYFYNRIFLFERKVVF